MNVTSPILRRLLVAALVGAAVAACSGGQVTTIAPSANPAPVPSDIAAIMNKPVYAKSTWALRVLDGEKVLIDLRSQQKLLVGSVRKVFSVGQLLNAVGPNHTYDTPVYRQGSVRGGILRGNLIVLASGDLTMGGRTKADGGIAISDWDHNEADSLGNAILTKPDPLAGYRTLARAVKAAGIDRISGDVAIDDRLFVPFNFREEFDVRPIFVNDDAVDLSIVPGGAVGSPGNLAWRPHSSALEIVNKLRVGAPGSKNTLAIDPELPACIGTPNCESTISGRLPSDFVPPLTNQDVLVQTVRIVQPSNYARTVFVELLQAAGVQVDAPAVEANPTNLLPSKGSYRPSDRVANLTGLPYRDDAKFVLKISYNIGADTSLVLFGLTHGVGSMPAALGVEQQNLAANYGISSSQYHFIDGSGGGDTTATSSAVTTMLDDLWRSPVRMPFFDALPILGVDGSLAFVKDFTKDPSLAGAVGNVRAKTGTFVGPNAAGTGAELKGQALGGYVTSKRGHHLTFQLVVNNVPISSIAAVTRVFQDQGTISAILWRDY